MSIGGQGAILNQYVPDFKITSPILDRQVLSYDAISKCFRNIAFTEMSGAQFLGDLQDVSLNNVVTGQALIATFDGTNIVWKNVDISAGANIRFTSLLDTNNSPMPNQYLKWNNFTTLDTDSQIQYISQIPQSDIAGLPASLLNKVDKVAGIIGNFVSFGASNAIADSGKKVSDFATAAQGILATSALQAGSNISLLANDSGYLKAGANISLLANNVGFISTVVSDSAPKLGGTLDLNNNLIGVKNNGDIELRLRYNSTTGAKGNIILDTLTFPNTDGAAGQALITDGSGNLHFGNAGSVTSVFSRSGIVTAASGDYTSSQVTNISTVSGATVSIALQNINAIATTAIQPGNNITLLNNNAGFINVVGSPTNGQVPIYNGSSWVPGASSGSAANLGAGTGVYANTTSGTMNFKSLVGTNGVSISNTSSLITISGNGSGTGLTDALVGVQSDAGGFTATGGSTFSILGGTGTKTRYATIGAAHDVFVDLSASINDLSDVDTSGGIVNGQTLSWNGTNFVPFTPIASIADAPSDNNTYGRKNGSWSTISASGAGTTEYVKVNYTVGNIISSLSSSSGLTVAIQSNAANNNLLISVTFNSNIGHTRLPSSIMCYGYDYNNSRYTVTHLDMSFGSVYTFLNTGAGPFDITSGSIVGLQMTNVQVAVGSTRASGIVPTNPTHAYLIFGW